MSGAGIMLLADDRPRGSLCTTNDVSALIEELQYTLGEGPCVDAHRQRSPVAEPDLAHPVELRWSAFAGPAVDAGARAVFGFPVTVGSVRLGALNLYRDQPGPLSADQHADALVVADVAARSIISMQADAVPGTIGVGLGGRGQLPLRRSPGRRNGRRTARGPCGGGVGAAAGACVQQRPSRCRRRHRRRQPAPSLRPRRRRRPRRPGRRREVIVSAGVPPPDRQRGVMIVVDRGRSVS